MPGLVKGKWIRLDLIYKRANRKYIAMTEDEVWRFIASREKMVVAFAMPDGYAHASPVWFCVANNRVYFRGADYKVKSLLARSGKATCVWEDGNKYKELKGVIMWGKSEIVLDYERVEWIQNMLNEKYGRMKWKPDEVPRSWADSQTKEKRTVVEIVPEKISSWDNSKLAPDRIPLHTPNE